MSVELELEIPKLTTEFQDAWEQIERALAAAARAAQLRYQAVALVDQSEILRTPVHRKVTSSRSRRGKHTVWAN